MAGYAATYCIGGGEGGADGSDGVNPIFVELWVGVSDRMWIEAVYRKHGNANPFSALAGASRIVPSSPQTALIEACIIFGHEAFSNVPGFDEVIAYFADKKFEMLDLTNASKRPNNWIDLVERCKLAATNIVLYGGPLRRCSAAGQVLAFDN